ncbi:glycosyltransferase [Clostridium tyrobutyricum]|uniref:glycosyltransferase n=1 Tax=Clostridium tyrobutyricum TaxID=1519 RepID=UPI0039F708E7
MKDNLIAAVVIYNMKIEESITCQNLEKLYFKIVYIVDNSTKDMGNSIIAAKKGWKYIDMHGNKGLPRAYNRVIELLEYKENDIIIWLDDDSHLTKKYLITLQNSVYNYPEIDIFVPIIMGQNGKFYSPNEKHFFKNKQMKRPSDIINPRRFNAINSCTAVRLRIYKDYKYDERMFLDQVDHKFFDDQRKRNKKFMKLNVIIEHNFSLKNKKLSPQVAWKRYDIMIPDFMTYCNTNIASRILGFIKVLGWGVRETKNYKNPIFIYWCIKKYITSYKETIN